MKLYLDDIRIIPQGWTGARNVREAQRLMANNEVTDLSLDFDLGIFFCRSCARSDSEEACFRSGGTDPTCGCNCHVLEPNGLKLLEWIRDENRWPKNKPLVHSANPVGVQQMVNFIKDFGPYE